MVRLATSSTWTALALAWAASTLVACEAQPTPPPLRLPTIGMSSLSTAFAPSAAASLTLADGTALSSWATEHGPFGVVFGYTGCPDVCPTTLAYLRRLDRALLAEHQRSLPVVFVAVDPVHDDHTRLTPYLAHFSPRFVAARGDVDDTHVFARSLQADFVQHDDGRVDHAIGMFVFGRALDGVALVPPRGDVTQAAGDLELLLRAAEDGRS